VSSYNKTFLVLEILGAKEGALYDARSEFTSLCRKKSRETASFPKTGGFGISGVKDGTLDLAHIVILK
jgi:hypothetical protein